MMSRKKFFRKARQQAPKGRRPSQRRLYTMWYAYEVEMLGTREERAAASRLAQRQAEQRRDLEKQKRKAAAAAASEAIRAAHRTIPLERTIRELDETFRARSEGL
jgi:hypothetical protein